MVEPEESELDDEFVLINFAAPSSPAAPLPDPPDRVVVEDVLELVPPVDPELVPVPPVRPAAAPAVASEPLLPLSAVPVVVSEPLPPPEYAGPATFMYWALLEGAAAPGAE